MSEPDPDPDSDDRPSPGDLSVRRALHRFGISIALTFLVLLVASFLLGRQIARENALHEARVSATSLADTLVSPAINSSVRSHRAGSMDELDRLLGDSMQRRSITHVKVWSIGGEILWADEPEIIGRRFPLPEEVRGLVATGAAHAEVSDLSKAENVAERADGRLLEVYVRARDSDGQPFVLEAYLPTDRLQEDQRRIVVAVVGVAGGALLLFAGAMLPLGAALARRIETARQDRLRMTRHALYASDLERRRIAQELHDGVIQDLAGISYLMPNLRRRADQGVTTDEDEQTYSRISALLTRDVAALRAMLVDLYPPNLERDGLHLAVENLVQDAVEAGIAVDVSIPRMTLPRETTRLVFGLLREGIRNSIKHADASTLQAQVSLEGEEVLVSIGDDGKGFPGVEGQAVDAEVGHFGLRLIHDVVEDIGGRLTLGRSALGGAQIEARFPVAAWGDPSIS